MNKRVSMGDKPLGWAAGNGYDGVVKLLLGKHDIDPGKPGKAGQTPLLQAARNGHEGAVKMLLVRDDVNPNEPNRSGRTQLLLAACDGYEVVVRLLLGWVTSIPTCQIARAEHPCCGIL